MNKVQIKIRTNDDVRMKINSVAKQLGISTNTLLVRSVLKTIEEYENTKK